MTAAQKWGEFAVAAFLVLTGAGFAALAWRLPGSMEPGVPGSATAPLFLGLLLAACGVVLAMRALALKAIGTVTGADFANIRNPLIGLALLIACTMALEPLGFILATFLFLVAGFMVLGQTPPKLALPAAAIGSMGLWVLFTKLLGVGLPYGLIENILFR